VPVTPEFGDVGIIVWPIEIFWNLDTEEPERADTDIGIRGKIRIDLDTVAEKPERENNAMSKGEVVHVEVIGVSGKKIGDSELFGKSGKNSREAALSIQRPVRGNDPQLWQKVLISLYGSGNHGREKENEGHVLADIPGLRFVAVAIPGVLEKFESEKGNPQGQEGISPVKSVLARHGPDQAGKEIPVFENDEKQDRPDDAEPAKPGSRLIKAANEGLSKKDEEACGTDGPAQLCV
jgi:hypothetical protein